MRLRTVILIALIPLGFMAVFYFFPLYSIIELSFSSAHGAQGTQVRDFSLYSFASSLRSLFSGYHGRILWFTFWQAALSSVLTILMALPAAYVFSHYSFPGRRLLMTLAGIPFVLPTIVVAAAFRALLGPKGVLNTWLMTTFNLSSPPITLDNSLWIILLAHVFYNFTIVLRIVGGFWSRIDPALTESARMLGASPWQAFRKVTLPLLAPAVCTAGLLVFVFCFCSFGVILILGGPSFATLEVAIYREAVHLFNLPMAAMLSLLQILFTFILMWSYTWLQRRTTHRIGSSATLELKRCTTGGARFAVFSQSLVVFFLLVLPLLALVYQSVMTADGITLDFYRRLFINDNQSVFFVAPADALHHSLGFGIATLALALVLGLSAAYVLGDTKGRFTSLLDPLFMLPLSTSAVTLGFGFIIALDEPPLNLRSSMALVPLAHALVAFPFVVRTILPVLRAIPANLREAATVLGASPWQIWCRIDMPLIGRTVAAAAIFAFTISLGEFGATVFVARPQTPTMPLAIYRFLGQPGALNYGQAMAMSSLLMLVTAVGFLLLERSTPRKWGEF